MLDPMKVCSFTGMGNLSGKVICVIFGKSPNSFGRSLSNVRRRLSNESMDEFFLLLRTALRIGIPPWLSLDFVYKEEVIPGADETTPFSCKVCLARPTSSSFSFAIRFTNSESSITTPVEEFISVTAESSLFTLRSSSSMALFRRKVNPSSNTCVRFSVSIQSIVSFASNVKPLF